MTIHQEKSWAENIREYCEGLNISVDDLYKIVTDLKVAPMIRGKAFEFSTYSKLKELLPSEDWSVTKPNMNAQTGIHDIDILVTHKPTRKQISVECKLASKGGFGIAQRRNTVLQRNDYFIKVKCMRSRTTKTASKVTAGARLMGISDEEFLAHSDQYRQSHFDVVATSIGNAFYQTIEDDEGNLAYIFSPTDEAIEFITKFNFFNNCNAHTEEILQEFVYNKIYFIRSSDLIVSPESQVVCTKRKCENKRNCGFIPNYPIINFGNLQDLNVGNDPSPINNWIGIENTEAFFKQFIEKDE